MRRFFPVMLLIAGGNFGCSSKAILAADAIDRPGAAMAAIESALNQTDYRFEPEELACLTEIDSKLGGAVLGILSDWQADDILEDLIWRRKLDSLLMDEVYVNKLDCSSGRALPLLFSIQSQNGAFLSARLSLDLVTRASAKSAASGAIDVISRHDSREGLSKDLRDNLLGIYGTLLTEGNLDPLSYAGLVDNISIRENGTQKYGSYSACIDGAWVFTYKVVDADKLDHRRAALLKDEEWPIPPPELCNAD